MDEVLPLTRPGYHPHPHLRLFLALGGIGLLVSTVLAGVAIVQYPAPASAPEVPVEIRSYNPFSSTLADEAKTVFELGEVPAAVVPGSPAGLELPPGATLRASWFGSRGREELNAVVRDTLSGFADPVPLVPEGLALPGRYEFVLGVVADGRLSLVFAHIWIEVRHEDG